MKFPKVIRHRKAEVTIYGKKPNYPFCRIAYRADGKRHLLNFSKYGDALKEAKKKAKDLAKGHPGIALSPAQSRDALAAIQRLEALQQSIGRRVSLQWYRDADQFGDFIVGKYKGPTGQFIPWKQLNAK